MNSTLTKRREFLVATQTRLADLQQAKSELGSQLAQAGQLKDDLEHARVFVNEVAIATQMKLKGLIEDVVTLALASVYGPAYSFESTYVVKRDRPQLEFKIKKGGITLDPKANETGGGVLDVAALGLRLVLWSLMRADNLLILDEPFKFVRSPGHDLMPKAAAMLNEVSNMLGVQIIVTTHSKELTEVADTVYEVSQTDGVSTVKLCE